MKDDVEEVKDEVKEVKDDVEEVKDEVKEVKDELEVLKGKIGESNEKNSREIQNLPKNEQASLRGKLNLFLAFID